MSKADVSGQWLSGGMSGASASPFPEPWSGRSGWKEPDLSALLPHIGGPVLMAYSRRPSPKCAALSCSVDWL